MIRRLARSVRALGHARHGTRISRSRDQQMRIYGRMWHGLAPSLTHADSPGALMTLEAIALKTKQKKC